MGCGEVVQSIPIEHGTYSRGVTLVHCIDAEREDDREILLASQFGK